MTNRRLRHYLLVTACAMMEERLLVFSPAQVHYRLCQMHKRQPKLSRVERQLAILVSRQLLKPEVPTSTSSDWWYRLTDAGIAKAEALRLQSA